MTGPDVTIARDYDYQTHDQVTNRMISLRQASIERDLGPLHQWLCSDHVKRYWQFDLPLPVFRETFRERLVDDYPTPCVECLNRDHVPMSYWAAKDDVANHYNADLDQDVHLLIGPEEYLGDGYALPLMRAVVTMRFRHPETDQAIAESDARNERVIHVFEKCGFKPREELYFDETKNDALLLVHEYERFESDVFVDATAAPAQGVSSDD